jgi:hypothetical protein
MSDRRRLDSCDLGSEFRIIHRRTPKALTTRFTCRAAGMDVISLGKSPVEETGSLKEVSIPNDRSDRQSTR